MPGSAGRYAANFPRGGGGSLLLIRRDSAAVLAGTASRIVGDCGAEGDGIGFYVVVNRTFVEEHVKELPY